MIESFVHSDYQIPEITRKLTLAEEQGMGCRCKSLCVEWIAKISRPEAIGQLNRPLQARAK